VFIEDTSTMKFGFGRKRRGAEKPLRDSMESSNSEYAVHMPSRSARHEGYGFDKEFDGDKKQGVGGLVRKLNCTASKRDAEFERYMDTIPSARKRDDSATWGWSPNETSRDITRPVLITVNDGASEDSKKKGSKSLEQSFVVGTPEKSKSESKFRVPFGRSSSLKNKKSSPRSVIPSPRRRTPSPSRLGFRRSGSNIKMPSSLDMQELMSPESSRKQRWRRALEKGWKDDSDVPSLVSDYNDESTFGSRSVFTGMDSHSAHTDYTTDVTVSDESEIYSSRRRRGYSSRGSHSDVSYGSYRSRDQGLWHGVAEDMGIIAGMLLSDGTACVGSMASITKETVTSCKGEH